MATDNNRKAVLELMRAGLWDSDARLSQYGKVDYEEVMRLAEEQSVVGLVTAGLEHVADVKVPQEMLLQFIGSTLQIEQHNLAMNDIIARLIEKLRNQDVYAILVKGQGIAQCYEKPLWRSSGDVDFLLSVENYEKAKDVLSPIADEVAGENKATMHQAFVIKGFDVELHGKMPFSLSNRVDAGIDDVLNDIFCRGNVRSWDCNGTQVFLPSLDNDVILIFTHFLHHFFIEGVGFRQICDWCRLLWTYRESLNYGLLEMRIRRMGLMTEWKVFGAMAVEYLGMPVEAMPLLGSGFTVKGSGLKRKAKRVLKRVLKSGNFGHNNDLSYRSKYSGLRYKVVAMWRRFLDFASLVPVFPVDAPSFFVTYLKNKVE